MTDYKTICIIPAGGSGVRLGEKTPKQYLKLNNKPLICYTIEVFLSHPKIDAIQLVVDEKHENFYKDIVKKYKLLPIAKAGKTRKQSVLSGLRSIKKHKPEKVLIHDGARPFVSQEIITNVITSLKKHHAVISAVKMQDTVKRCHKDIVTETIQRDELVRVQTPQGFHYNELLCAHEKLDDMEFTDDACLYEYLGKSVNIVEGSELNFKITTKEDLLKAKQMLINNKQIRTGMGFDVHSFCPAKSKTSNTIMLCGIAVPHPESLKGHSDSDVGLHAITDAILGAISKQDIGYHFPPTDSKYKDVDSSLFIKKAKQLLEEEGGVISNIDITLICEAPKIGKYRDKMIKRIASLLDIEQNQVSVKATTTEKLGFTGRKEGIAAQAITTVYV